MNNGATMNNRTIRGAMQGLSATAALLAIGVMLTGMKSCGGDPPPKSQQCEVAADCTGLPHIECVGSFSCDDGACLYTCTSGCTMDADCPQGQLCVSGSCTEPQPPGCQDDADCGAGEMCVFPLTGCPPDAPCPDAASQGQCVPKPEGCSTDADCLPGQICAVPELMPCAEGDACTSPVFYGECVGEPGCASDSDCGAGEQCLLPPCAPCPYDAECPPCLGTCEAVSPWECSADADCGSGRYCDFIECNDCSCPPNAMCDCVQECGGVCRDETPEGCESDADCADDEYCELPMWFSPNDPDGQGSDSSLPWVPVGECKKKDVPSGCESDSDCGAGEMCVMACPACWCEDDSDCDCGPCFGECVVVSPPAGCESDAQCGAGETCELSCAPCWFYCEEGAEDCECPCVGQCVPTAPQWCTSDAECGPGQFCHIEGDICDCPPGSDCLCPQPVGTCLEAPEPTECQTTGCSGEICAAEDMASICIWDPSFSCLELTTCGNYAPNGGCGFEPNDAYLACLADFGVQP